jgi:hypothetical protein
MQPQMQQNPMQNGQPMGYAPMGVTMGPVKSIDTQITHKTMRCAQQYKGRRLFL